MRILLIILVFFLSACAPDPALQSLETLVQQNATARGGADRLEGLHAIEVELKIVEPTFTVTGHYRATREGHMRIDVFAGDQRVFTEALGPGGGWQMFDDGEVKELSEDGEKALKRGIVGNLYALYKRDKLGYDLSLVGKTDYQGKAYFQLQEVSPDGFSKQLFIDPETFLVIRDMETSALHPDMDPTKQRQETRHMNFTKTDGMIFSTRSETYDLDTGQLMQTTTIKKRVLNPDIDPQTFARPTD